MIDALGKRIASLRHKAGLSQAKLADRLGISASAIGMYEQGRREPPLDILVSMSAVFGVTTDYLISGRIRSHRDWKMTVDSNLEKYSQLAAVLLWVVLHMEDSSEM